MCGFRLAFDTGGDLRFVSIARFYRHQIIKDTATQFDFPIIVQLLRDRCSQAVAVEAVSSRSRIETFDFDAVSLEPDFGCFRADNHTNLTPQIAAIAVDDQLILAILAF